ncbi:LAMI_0C03070g1_1 [Lachancea mirantina]|uniref:LAMI_0C03070g1_1 n=1 Tax=Lachancea mirantina TaxID=1230905 RepID=A0A1G4J1I9_9SACH|nr:LAMI_0C03070g1_1 [Lachancea mirantina]
MSTIYKKETKTGKAIFPRSDRNSTLDFTRDRLEIVYDVFTARDGNQQQDGAPCINLVFLHPSGMSRVIWEDYLQDFFQHSTSWTVGKIILLDQVNHGDSGVINKNKLGSIYDWSDGSRDVCEIASKELFSQNGDNNGFNIVIGHSMGGFQALGCGVLYPGLFDLIICIEPVVLMKNIHNPENVTKIPIAFHDGLWSKMTDQFNDLNHFEKFLCKGSFYVTAQENVRDRISDFEKMTLENGTIKTKMDKYQHMITYLCLRPYASWLMGNLRFLTPAVVCLYGEKSKWCPKENRELLKREIKNYKEEDLVGADHLVTIENPELLSAKLCEHIKQFLKETPRKQQRPLTAEDRLKRFKYLYADLLKQRVGRGFPKV